MKNAMIKMSRNERAMSDSVNHPNHYGANENGIECIQVTECMNFNLGNAVKYVWRAGRKGDGVEAQIEDLEKARKYLEFEVDRIKRLNDIDDSDDCGCAAEFSKTDEQPKSGYLYVAPLGTEAAVWPEGWVPLGYTDEGHSESFSFTLPDVSVENFQRAFDSTYPVTSAKPQPVNKLCCVDADYTHGTHHSTGCDVEAIKRIEAKRRERYEVVAKCQVNACPNVGHPLEDDGCPPDHAG